MNHPPPPPRIGSLCSGYRGLDMAVEQVFGGTTAWVSDVDPGANKILAHHWPTTPNIGDLTTTRWDDVEPVDIVCGGYPCQPFSLAGELKGTDDVRHLWPFIARALGVLRPRVAIFENVANHLRVGFDAVLRDLADLGFDVEWDVVRADEVGAPHQRRRLFIYATAQDTDSATRGERRLAAPGQAEGRRARADAGRRGGTPSADPGSARLEVGRVKSDRDQLATAERGGSESAADTCRGELAEQPVSNRGSHDQADPAFGVGVAANTDSGRRGPEQPDVPAGQPDADWGAFAPAITRWEAATGRRAPWATDDRRRLNPAFVEWMMGLPAGHVTDVPDLTRTQQLKALGNGVVPQQAAAALRLLAARAGMGVAA
ncbi:DNA cytosine methyltransferase [Streptomyces siamensis]|uniref:DNA (cytosine-5-)-methyltransferase n=1 Tax=Streptomyces siamensis TaxID=1274986 RepID=A0ABP9JKQ3_9ACTN